MARMLLKCLACNSPDNKDEKGFAGFYKAFAQPFLSSPVGRAKKMSEIPSDFRASAKAWLLRYPGEKMLERSSAQENTAHFLCRRPKPSCISRSEASLENATQTRISWFLGTPQPLCIPENQTPDQARYWCILRPLYRGR